MMPALMEDMDGGPAGGSIAWRWWRAIRGQG